MFKPSPTLCARRLRLTTKQVLGDYYKGTRTGSMGAHTEYGGYLIDWRKVRHFNMPDLTGFKLTPFVTNEMEPTKRTVTREDGTKYTATKPSTRDFLWTWKTENPDEYDQIVEYQRNLINDGNAVDANEELSYSSPAQEDKMIADRQFMDEKKA